MIEILRQQPQSNWDLLLIFVLVSISVFLYNTDSRRFIYFYRSLYNKQYEISYGRQIKQSHYFLILLSLQSILTYSFVFANYLLHYSRFVDSSFLFLNTFIAIVIFIGVKWLLIYFMFLLFKKDTFFNYLSLYSTQYTNIFNAPLLVLSIFLYLNSGFSQQISEVLTGLALLLLIFSKMSVFTYMRKTISLNGFYIILYLCTFEIAPLLWVLIGLNY